MPNSQITLMCATICFKQDIKSGRMKPIADMLQNDPSLRCYTTPECLEQVKSNSRVYSAVSTHSASRNTFLHYIGAN